MDHIDRNMTISEFAEMTGIPVTTLRDWNKRGLSRGIGQPDKNGRWLYSKSDTHAVFLAGLLYGDGFGWRFALFAGHLMNNHLVEQKHRPSEPSNQQRFFAFCGFEHSAVTNWGCGATIEEAVAEARSVSREGNLSVSGYSTVVFDLDELAAALPLGAAPDMANLDE